MTSIWDFEVDDRLEQKVASSRFGLPIPTGSTSKAEIVKKARKLSRSIFNDYDQLRKILERHEAVLQKRWLKKTHAQRKKILLTAWPNMSASHSPHYRAFHKESEEQRRGGTSFREAYLWPYVNQEDLSKGKNLLFFINARGRHPPWVFLHTDDESYHFGEVSHAIKAPFLDAHTILLHGQRTADTYGRIVQDEIEKHADGFFPGHGLLILEVQNGILRFLVECCHLILHDLPPASLIDDGIPVQPEPPPLFTDELAYPSAAALAAEATYHPPAYLDFNRLLALISARRSEAVDHVWALREDPSYFAETVLEWSEHHYMRVLDKDGRQHPFVEDIGSEQSPLWDKSLNHCVSVAYSSLMTWTIASEQVEELAALRDKYSTVIQPQKRLPPEYENAMLLFYRLLNSIHFFPLFLLSHGFNASPPMRSSFIRNETSMKIERKLTSQGEDPYKEELIRIFDILVDQELANLFGRRQMIDEYEYLMHTHLVRRELISPWVARVLSDLALVEQLGRQIEIHLAQSGVTQPEEAMSTKEMVAKNSKILNPVMKLHTMFDKIEGNGMKDIGAPIGKRFYYPTKKPRTKETVDALRSAEKNLDAFWNRVDKLFFIGSRTELFDLHRKGERLAPEKHQLQRTPEWVEEVPREWFESIADDTKLQAPEHDYHRAGPYQTDHDRSRLSEDASPTPAKVKSRGAANPGISTSTFADPTPDAAQATPETSKFTSANALLRFSQTSSTTP